MGRQEVGSSHIGVVNVLGQSDPTHPLKGEKLDHGGALFSLPVYLLPVSSAAAEMSWPAV